MRLESPFAAALNHLIENESWARERLAPFAGETVELCGPLLPPLRFFIQDGGRLAPAPHEGEATLEVRFGARGVEVFGNARLATEVQALVRHLRWDVEEDLAKVVGDVAAHRLAQGARDFLAWQADAARRLAMGAADYAAEEKRWLVRRAELQELTQAAEALWQALARLESRVRRLA